MIIFPHHQVGDAGDNSGGASRANVRLFRVSGGHRPDHPLPVGRAFPPGARGRAPPPFGSLHAQAAGLALRTARDLYTRRAEGTSIWVVPATEIVASSPDEKDAFFDPAADKVYRHPTFYDVPEGLTHL